VLDKDKLFVLLVDEEGAEAGSAVFAAVEVDRLVSMMEVVC